MENNKAEGETSTVKTSELKALGFIVVVLFPILAVAFVGFYGLCVFLYTTFVGIPGHG